MTLVKEAQPLKVEPDNAYLYLDKSTTLMVVLLVNAEGLRLVTELGIVILLIAELFIVNAPIAVTVFGKVRLDNDEQP